VEAVLGGGQPIEGRAQHQERAGEARASEQKGGAGTRAGVTAGRVSGGRGPGVAAGGVGGTAGAAALGGLDPVGIWSSPNFLGVTGRPLATSPVFLGIFGLSARSAALSWDTPDTCTLRDGSEELSPLDGLTTEDTAETPLFSA
jgi:hypothetical protein